MQCASYRCTVSGSKRYPQLLTVMDTSERSPMLRGAHCREFGAIDSNIHTLNITGWNIPGWNQISAESDDIEYKVLHQYQAYCEECLRWRTRAAHSRMMLIMLSMWLARGNFRLSMQGWLKKRVLLVQTRTLEEGKTLSASHVDFNHYSGQLDLELLPNCWQLSPPQLCRYNG